MTQKMSASPHGEFGGATPRVAFTCPGIGGPVLLRLVVIPTECPRCRRDERTGELGTYTTHACFATVPFFLSCSGVERSGLERLCSTRFIIGFTPC